MQFITLIIFHLITLVTSVACDGLWDTITPEEATRLQAVHGDFLLPLSSRLVFQHLKEHQTDGGDLENLAAKLATIAKEKVQPFHFRSTLTSKHSCCRAQPTILPSS